VSPRRRLLRWLGSFALANAALLGIIGLRYLWLYTALGRAVSWSYALVAYVGHMSALACVPLLVLLVPVALAIPRPRLVLPLAVVVSSAGVAFLVLDSLLFAENRYHLSVLTFRLLEPQTWAFMAVYAAVALAIESMLAGWIWQRTAGPGTRRVRRYVALGLAGCFVSAHLAHAWAAAHYDGSVTGFTRYLPLYYPLRKPALMARLGLIDRAAARERGVGATLDRQEAGELIYPLAPLRCEPNTPALNVLLVVIDAMRADAMTPAIAPRLTAFARHSIEFDRHYSGGNSSRAGMFSLFYAIPATYFDEFASRARAPVLMNMIREHGYQLGIFTSAPVYRLVDLDRTAFAHVPDLRRETRSGEGSVGRDRVLTGEWLDWLGRRDPARPFFGFLYYDGAVKAEPPRDYHPPIPTPARASKEHLSFNVRYLEALHYVDSLLGQVLDDLERRKLLDRTIVIVTSDHGIEFDENRLGFKGHGTAYSEEQMRTPLVVRWPGRPPGKVDRRTSHNDLAPTLLTELFRCANPPSDYASGWNLFSDAQWTWLVVASYREYAVVEPGRVTVIFPAGYEVRGPGYRLASSQAPPRDALRAAMAEMSRFYR
jgi:membrane-anchored protein YejM (alkaline phosphatase superfamily)